MQIEEADMQEDKRDIHDRVKGLREKLRLSQAAFGEKLLLERSAISLIERKQRNITDRTIHDICREYNVNEAWLRTGEGETFTAIHPDIRSYSRFGHIMEHGGPFKKNLLNMLLEIMTTLPDEQWENLWNEFKACVEATEKET